jgi:hypothetical protein
VVLGLHLTEEFDRDLRGLLQHRQTLPHRQLPGMQPQQRVRELIDQPMRLRHPQRRGLLTDVAGGRDLQQHKSTPGTALGVPLQLHQIQRPGSEAVRILPVIIRQPVEHLLIHAPGCTHPPSLLASIFERKRCAEDSETAS